MGGWRHGVADMSFSQVSLLMIKKLGLPEAMINLSRLTCDPYLQVSKILKITKSVKKYKLV